MKEWFKLCQVLIQNNISFLLKFDFSKYGSNKGIGWLESNWMWNIKNLLCTLDSNNEKV